jgi:hypothetical protein
MDKLTVLESTFLLRNLLFIIINHFRMPQFYDVERSAVEYCDM